MQKHPTNRSSKFFINQLVLLLTAILFLIPISSQAAIEIALNGDEPQSIDEIYLKSRVPYIALDDLLPLIGEKRGRWNSVHHIYTCKIAGKKVSIAPQATFFTVDSNATPLEQPALFIDNRFRVPEDFIIVHLPLLLQKPIYYRNTEPMESIASTDSDNDDIFSYLMQRSDRDTNATALRIVIDPGHGGEDSGTFGGADAKEKEISLAIAKQLERQLKMRLDAEVHLVRDGDYTVPREKRHTLLKEAAPDLLIILHVQASLRSESEGMSLFIMPETKTTTTATDKPNYSLQLAKMIGKSALKHEIGVEGILRAKMLPLVGGDLPTVMVEIGYLSNEQDRIMLTDIEGQAEYAEAIYAGIKNFWEVELKENTL